MSEEKKLAENLAHEKEGEADLHHAPGTTVLVIVLLISFAVYFFANWKALAEVWEVR